MNSAIFRKAVIEVINLNFLCLNLVCTFAFHFFFLIFIQVDIGRSDIAHSLICDSLNDGSLFVSAGFDTPVGSYYSPDYSIFETLSVDSTIAKGRSNVASCMGSPCVHAGWGDDCNIVCMCPKYTFEKTTDDDDDRCYSNGLSVDVTLPWEYASSLFEYIDDLQTKFKDISSIFDALEGNCSKCTVH